MRSSLLELSFHSYQKRTGELADYIGSASDHLVASPASLPIFVQSLIVLTVSLLEHFLESLLALSCHEREQRVRRYLVTAGVKHDADCDRRALISHAKKRVNFKAKGQQVNDAFVGIFGETVWPSPGDQQTILDLVQIRNTVVMKMVYRRQQRSNSCTGATSSLCALTQSCRRTGSTTVPSCSSTGTPTTP